MPKKNSGLYEVERVGHTAFVVLRQQAGTASEPEIAAQLDGLARELAGGEVRGVVIDLQNVSYCKSVLLNALLGLWKQVREDGTTIALCNPSPLVREILEVSNLQNLWPICSSQDEAREALNR